MLIDAFTFFNEFDILEARLEYLSPCVDYFILVESNISHSGKPKPFYFLENKERFAKYADKIIYHPYIFDNNQEGVDFSIAATDDNSPFWAIEKKQRNHITTYLANFADTDQIMISDVDEIPSKYAVAFALNDLTNTKNAYATCIQEFYYYNLNNRNINPWPGTVISQIRQVKQLGAQWFRDNRFDSNITHHIANGGWHLSYFNNITEIVNKIENFAHQEVNTEHYKDPDKIKQRIEQGIDIFERLNDKLVRVELSSFPQDFLKSFSKFGTTEKSKIKVFVHYPDIPNSKAIINQQINLLVNSELINNSEVFFSCCSYGIEGFDWLKDKLKDYPNVRYIEQLSSPVEAEIDTLIHLKNYCDTHNDCYVLYLHTKGATHLNNDCVSDWRDMMLHINVTEWRTCLSKLKEGYNTVGANWLHYQTHPHYSGNFWWATSDYIKSLPSLTRPAAIDSDSQLGANIATNRLDAELWIGLNNPKACSLFNFEGNHYYNRCNRELYFVSNKISVIVPTMWKFEPFLDFIAELVQQDNIGEVIIINNNINDTPVHAVLTHPKIVMFNQEENIFVNPAWNLGVKHSRFDKLCILNDDLIFDLKLINKVHKFLTPGKLVGLSSGIVEYGQTPLTDGSINFEYFTTQACYGLGCLMFITKQDWIDIPDAMKLYYGDNLIFDTMLYRFNQNYFITNMFHFTPYATTTSTLHDHASRSEDEKAIYRPWIAEFKHKMFGGT